MFTGLVTAWFCFVLFFVVVFFVCVLFPPHSYCHFHMQAFGAGERQYELTSHVLQSNTIQAETAFAHDIRKCSKCICCVVVSFYTSENGRVAGE